MTSERPASSRGGMPQRPTTSGGQRPTTSNRPMSRRGSAMTPAGGRPFSRQASAIGGRPLGSAIGGPGGGAGGRLGSAMHRTAVPGTASRLQGMKIQDLNWKKIIIFFSYKKSVYFSQRHATKATLFKGRYRTTNPSTGGRQANYSTRTIWN